MTRLRILLGLGLWTAATLPAQFGNTLEVWKQLQASYDKNGDGKITAAEYTRSARGFKNLDRNRDGSITEADFGPMQGPGGGANRRGAQDREARRAVLARQLGDIYGSFFNRDGKPGISREEWKRTLRILAPGKDGTIPRSHISRITGRAGQNPMAKRYLRNRLEQVLDFDGDRKHTVADLDQLFAFLDVDGNGTIDQGEEIDMPHSPGTVAPDFTLPLADDGKKTVTLSSFRGKKPVALIFGSYT